MLLSGRALRLPSAFVLAALAACGGKPAPNPAPAPVAEVVAAPVDTAPARVDTVTVRDPALDQRINRLELQLLEKDAQIEQLEARVEAARLEVVRSMAKLRTLATRAEAASAMAEAELAVQALTGARGNADVTQARRLLDQSGEAFNRENFGGAVYLANLAKETAGTARARVGEGGRGAVRGEVAFATPVRMEAVGRTNVRSAPGTEASVLFVVERGAQVQAVSYVGEWVRITDAEGRGGWMIRARLSRPGEAGR